MLMNVKAAPLIVYAIEGVHGAGKSTLIAELKEHGKHVLEENFIDLEILEDFKCNDVTTGIVWLNSYVERVCKFRKENPMAKILFTDRGPISAAVYRNELALMEALVHKVEKELAETGIIIMYLYLKQPLSTLQKRLMERLKVEPQRKKFNEHKYYHLKSTYDRYQYAMKLKEAPKISLYEDIIFRDYSDLVFM